MKDIVNSLITGDFVKKIGKDRIVIFIIFGLLLVVVSLPTGSKTKNISKVNDESTKNESHKSDSEGDTVEISNDGTTSDKYATLLEDKLEAALHNVDGVGMVDVMITLQSSEEMVTLKDESLDSSISSETDSEGGTRDVTETNSSESTIYGDGETPYVTKELKPKIEGVLVVAQGGDNKTVCQNITEAIQALFGVEVHKIKIAKMKLNN